MTFEYLQRIVVDAQLDIENIGDCYLRAYNDFGEEFYLIIKTQLGETEVIEYGPCVPELQMLHQNYQITYSRFEYNQGKLERIIDKFLNNPKRGITQAEVSSLELFRKNLVNPIDKIFPENEGVSDGKRNYS